MKILSKFPQKFRENLENFLNMDLSGGMGEGAEPPEASENIKKLVQNSTGTSKLSKIFMNSESILY